MCYCSNIDGLFEALESEHHSNEWRLFIDSSKASLKAVLLNNGNENPSILLIHAAALNETHKTIELILRSINYSPYNWNISCDLKVIGLLLGMQIGYTKHQRFLCFWDSRDDEQHYIKKNWPLCEAFVPEIHHIPQVDPKKIYLPPMQIGLFKNFVNVTDQDDCGFRYLQQKLSAKSEAKLKAGIFIRPEIRKLINDKLGRNQNPLEKKLGTGFAW